MVIVSDIGCSGLSDQYFVTSAFHGLHGRSITYATGIKLARPDLDVVVVMGDGGTGIGGAHLLNAARRNIGITVLVFNNFNFGMTGGQHSTTTPAGAFTSTTAGGNLERPLDICATVAVNGAGYVWRGTSFDEDLPERIAEAMDAKGFALLDIWELCTAYFVRSNKFTRRAFQTTLDELGWSAGLLQHRPELPEYATAYRAARQAGPLLRGSGAHPGDPAVRPRPPLRPARGRVGRRPGPLGVRLTAQAAIRSGLYAAQADDYPITVRSGHSLSTLVLSPEPLDFAGVGRPRRPGHPQRRRPGQGAGPAAPHGPRGHRSRLPRGRRRSRRRRASSCSIRPPPAPAWPRADHGLAACAAAIEVLGLFPTDGPGGSGGRRRPPRRGTGQDRRRRAGHGGRRSLRAAPPQGLAVPAAQSACRAA